MVDVPQPEPQNACSSVDAPWKQSGISVPDSPLIDRAIEFCRQHYEPSLFNHVIRSWFFTVRIAHSTNTRVDDEVIAVSVLMHDLGLTSAFAGPNRFEVEGANAARDFALRHGLNDLRCRLVWDSVALHAVPSLYAHKEAEVALCGAGIAIDHEGKGLEQIPSEELDIILGAFPRLDLKRVLKNHLVRLAKSKPVSSHEGLVRDFGRRFVAGYPNYSSVDSILNAPFEAK